MYNAGAGAVVGAFDDVVVSNICDRPVLTAFADDAEVSWGSFSELLQFVHTQHYVPSRTLRSSDSHLLSVPRLCTCFGSHRV